MRGSLLALAGAVSCDATNPVEKVITVLGDIQQQLSKDADDDEAVYHKAQCFCKESIPALETSIAEGKLELKRQQDTKTTQLGIVGDREAKIKIAGDQLTEAKESLQKAREDAMKRTEDYNSNHGYLVATLHAIEAALEVVGRRDLRTQVELLQAEKQQISQTLTKSYAQLGLKSVRVLKPSQREFLKAFLQQPTTEAFQTQSNGIVGILEQMQEEFSADKEETDADHKRFLEGFNKAKTAYEEQITSFTDEIAEKTSQRDAAKAAASEAQVQIDERTQILADDKTRLDSTKVNCEQAAKDYEERTTSRDKERVAVVDALKILRDPNVRETFLKMSLLDKKTTTSFLQLKSLARQQEIANQVATQFKAAARKYKNAKFGTLARQIALMQKREGWQNEVCEAIGNMVSTIEEQLEEHKMKKDGCDAGIKQTAMDIATHNNTRNSFQADVDLNTQVIDSLVGTQIPEIEEKIAGLKQEQNEAALARQEANAVYVKQREADSVAIGFVKKAIAVLGPVFKKAALLQQPADAPPGFSKTNKSRGNQGNTVVVMLQKIVDDTEDTVKQNTAIENESVAAYAEATTEIQKSLKEQKESLTVAQANLAEEKGTLQENQVSYDAADAEFRASQKKLRATKVECRFTLSQYEVTKGAMLEEKSQLIESKVVLDCGKE